MPFARHRPRLPRRHPPGWSRSLSLALLALLAPGAHGAGFAPGAAPDPATGDEVPRDALASEPLRATGFTWTLGPWQRLGTLSADMRWQRLGEGHGSRQQLLLADIEWASYLWQPWFVQLRFGLGGLVARDAASSADADGPVTSQGRSLTARLSLSVFPASRFPFELRADLGDSRAGGDALGGDLRTQRLSLSQSFRPETGNSLLQLRLDRSQLQSQHSRDVLTNLQADGEHRVGDHTLNLGASWSLNQRSDTQASSRLAALNARHGYRPENDLQVDTLASWNTQRLQGFTLFDRELGSDIRQISSVLSWRPIEGEPLYREALPLQLVGSARWVEARTLGAGEGARAQAYSGTLGANLDLSRDWRVSGSVAASRVESGNGPASQTASSQASAQWTPPSRLLGAWRYGPSATMNAGLVLGGVEGRRHLVGLQGSHGLSRDWRLADEQQLALTLSQSAAVLKESLTPGTAQALAHSLGLFWQSAGDGSSQRQASLSISDSRSRAASRGSFQLVNLQLSQRSQLSRDTSWSANLTLQATRNRSSELDVFSGQHRTVDAGWQQFHSGGASLEQLRLFGVPRLRHTLQFSINSQQIERRALGDIDAPRERITQSLESRLDYTIGRLELRLSARAARIDDRSVAVVMARLQRRF